MECRVAPASIRQASRWRAVRARQGLWPWCVPPKIRLSVLVEHSTGTAAGEIAEHRIAGLPGAGRVVVKEQPDDVAGCEQPLYRLAAGIDHARLGVDLDAAEAERDAARDRIGAERTFHDRHRPVGLLRCDADGTLAVELAG